MESEQSKVVINCSLCNEKELQIIKDKDGGMLQCLNCGYMTSDIYDGDKENNESYKKLDDQMKKWAVESNGNIWIPSIVNLPLGILYPIDREGKMNWAFAPIVIIPEEEQKNYPNSDGGNYTQRYNIDKQVYFDVFGKAIQEINTIIKMRKDHLENQKSDA